MTTPLEPAIPQAGITQREVVDFASQLRNIGLTELQVQQITHRLTTIANEAAFKGATEVALTIRQTRLEEQQRWEAYTDQVLRKLLQLMMNMPATMMLNISRAGVIAAITAEIKRPDQGLRPNVINGVATS